MSNSNWTEIFKSKEIKIYEWILFFILSFVITAIPTFALLAYSDIDATAPTGIIVILVLALSALMGNYLKEKRLGQSSSSFQKLTIALIVIFLLADVASIAVFITNPPKVGKDLKLQRLNTEFMSIVTYYNKESDKIMNSIFDKADSYNWTGAITEIDSFDKIQSEMINKQVQLCERASNEEIDLNQEGYKELMIHCKYKDALMGCKDESMNYLREFYKFMRDIKLKTKADCYQLLEDTKPSEVCNNFMEKLGTPFNYQSDLTKICEMLQ